jgi:hypothetical protein
MWVWLDWRRFDMKAKLLISLNSVVILVGAASCGNGQTIVEADVAGATIIGVVSTSTGPIGGVGVRAEAHPIDCSDTTSVGVDAGVTTNDGTVVLNIVSQFTGKACVILSAVRQVGAQSEQVSGPPIMLTFRYTSAGIRDTARVSLMLP